MEEKKKICTKKLIIVMLHIELVINIISGHFVINLHSTGGENDYYFIYAFVGNPPQKQSLILDSGSSQISFACSTCSNCGMHEYPPFDLNKSITGRKCNGNLFGHERCKYFHRFSEGSVISGKYFSDIMRFENAPEKSGIKKDFKIKYDYFGCNELETKNIYNQNATGVFGIGPKFSLNDHVSITHFLLDSIGNFLNINDSNTVISICFLNTGGRIRIGEYNEKIVDNGLVFSGNQLNIIDWVPIVHPSSLYKVSIEGISIGKKELSLLSEEVPHFAIIDIGSTFSFLPSKVYNKLIGEFSKICASLVKLNIDQCTAVNKSLCLSDYSKFKLSLPIINIKFGGQENLTSWKYTSYLIKRGKSWCVGIKEQTSDQNHIVLGISFLKNRQLILDPKKKRIGINPSVITKCKGD